MHCCSTASRSKGPVFWNDLRVVERLDNAAEILWSCKYESGEYSYAFIYPFTPADNIKTGYSNTQNNALWKLTLMWVHMKILGQVRLSVAWHHTHSTSSHTSQSRGYDIISLHLDATQYGPRPCHVARWPCSKQTSLRQLLFCVTPGDHTTQTHSSFRPTAEILKAKSNSV